MLFVARLISRKILIQNLFLTPAGFLSLLCSALSKSREYSYDKVMKAVIKDQKACERIFAIEPPFSIVVSDYYSISGSVGSKNVEFRTQHVAIEDFLANANTLAPAIVEGLLNPDKHHEVKELGKDYWRDPPHESSGRTFSDYCCQ